MKLASLVSGGKDSLYATYLSMKQGHEIKYLVTMIPRKIDSWMFHHPCVELTKLQAEAMGIKQIIQKTSGEKEKELSDLKNVLKKIKNEIDGVVSGALASNYQKMRIDNVCKKLGLESLAPLWGIDTEQHWKNLLENNFIVMITGIASEGLDERWLGRIIDWQAIEELNDIRNKFGLHPGFEGGEAESLVLECPLFKKRLVIKDFEKVIDRKTNSGYLKVTDATLVNKN